VTSLEKIIDVIEQIQYDTLPESIVQKTKELVADWMCVTVAGSVHIEAKRMMNGLSSNNFVNDLEQFACWLGTTSRMLDIDDGHRFAMGHPGVVVVSTAVATALQVKGISGEKLIEAIVRGYEMYCYQGRVINPSAYLQRGFDATGVCGAPAAAVVASSLMGLSRDETKNAVALAATLCGGLNQAAIDGSMQKYVLAGWASKLGVMASTLAKAGIDGPIGAYEGRLGYCNAFSPSPDLMYLNSPKLVYDIQRVYTKIYACVRRIHTSLDAVEAILARNGWALEGIEHIDVYGCQFIVQAGNYTPQNMAQAQTSIPYAIAILLKFGKVTEALVKDNVKNAAVSAIASRIKIHLDDSFVKMAEEDKSLWGAAKVKITTVDGISDEEMVIYPRGEVENPFSLSEIKQKFMTMTSEALTSDRTQKLWELVMALETQADLEPMMVEIRNLTIN
jgi:2-methylcitrate dehydratase PrpD